MSNLLLRADDVLRRRAWTTRSPQEALPTLIWLIVVFGMVYGAVMGSFGGFSGERFWQVFYSAVKVPLLLFATFVVGFGSFFTLSTLLGLRDDLGEVVRALFATQAGVAVVLASLAPFTGLWYASTGVYETAPLFNAGMFAIASFAGQWLLRAYYRPLIQKNRRHRWMLWTWMITYAFIGIQMAWVLRPFVGSPDLEVQFFREESWDNAYVILFRTVMRLAAQ